MSPELKKSNKPKSSCSSVGKRTPQGVESENSRKNSTETDYFTESSLHQHDKLLS